MNRLILLLAAFLALIPAMVPIAGAQVQAPQVSVVLTRYDPFPAEPGGYITLWIKLQNIGSVPANNVTVELLDTYPFSLNPGEERVKRFDTVLVTEPILAQYRVRVAGDAADGANPIDLKIGLNQNTFIIKSFDIYVESKLVDFAIGSILSDPENLYSDTKDNKLTISLQNIGEGTAKLVTTELSLPDGFVPSQSYSDSYSIGGMAPDASSDAVFYVDIEKGVSEGEHLGSLTVRYKEDQDSEYKRRVLTVRLPVRASPSLEITGFSLNPDSLGQGMQGVEMVLEITNEGSREAENVNARVLKEATQPFSFVEKSDFVGNLQPNETGQAVFHFDVDSTADLKKYILDIELRYTEDSSVKIVDDTVSFSVSQAMADYTPLYILAIIIAAAAVAGIWFIRR